MDFENKEILILKIQIMDLGSTENASFTYLIEIWDSEIVLNNVKYLFFPRARFARNKNHYIAYF